MALLEFDHCTCNGNVSVCIVYAISQVLDLVTEIFNNGGCEELGVPVRDPILPQ